MYIYFSYWRQTFRNFLTPELKFPEYHVHVPFAEAVTLQLIRYWLLCHEYHCRLDNYVYLCGKFNSKPMATTGYIFLSKKYDTLEEDRKWMIDYGCDCIIEENGAQEKLRPQWKKVLGNCSANDTIVISRLSNALRGVRELGAFLDLCNQYNLRLICIQDRIDTGGELFNETTAAEVLSIIGRLSSEATVLRRREARSLQTGASEPKTIKAGMRKDREKAVVKMYKAGKSIDDIWKASGYRSRTSVFRVLARNGVELNRGPHQGSIKKRSEK